MTASRFITIRLLPAGNAAVGDVIRADNRWRKILHVARTLGEAGEHLNEPISRATWHRSAAEGTMRNAIFNPVVGHASSFKVDAKGVGIGPFGYPLTLDGRFIAVYVETAETVGDDGVPPGQWLLVGAHVLLEVQAAEPTVEPLSRRM